MCEGEWLQPHAGLSPELCRAQLCLGLNAAPVQASIPPSEKQRAVITCSKLRLPETATNRARTDTVQNSVENKSMLPMFCCPLPGRLVK